MSSRGYALIYSILFVIFMAVMTDSYYFSNEIKRLDKRIEELETSINIYKVSIIDTQAAIESYKLETTSLEKLINDRSNELKDLAEEIELQKAIAAEKDIQLMAQLIEAESGNQPFEGKLAVGTVVMNRIQSDEFPDTIRDVIFQRGQFQVVGNGKIYNQPSEDSLEAAKEIMDGKRVLNDNVLYFYNPKITASNNWIRKLKVSRVIKDHSFS